MLQVKSLVDDIGVNKTITFKLRVTHNGQEETKSIAVSSDSTNLKNGDVIDNKDTKLSISGISDTATIRVNDGRVVSENGEFIYSSNYKWIENESYNIIRTSKGGKYSGIRMYNLSFDENTFGKCDNLGTYNYNCSIPEPQPYAGQATHGSSKTNGWAYASWLEVDGSVKVTLGEPEEENGCPREYDNADENLYCERNGEFEQIVVEDIEIKNTFNEYDEEYYTYNIQSSTGSGCMNDGSLTRTITTSACISQYGEATFKLDDNELYSGGGFNFYANYNSTTTYNFCQKSGNRYLITMKIKDKYCKRNGCCPCDSDCGKNKNKCCCNKIDCFKSKTKYYSVVEGSEEWDLVTEKAQKFLQKPNDNAITKSLDSNDVNNTEMKKIGYWTVKPKNKTLDSNGDTSHWEPGEEITYNLTFHLDRACINRQTAEVTYIDKNDQCKDSEIDGGILYYTPIKLGIREGVGYFPIQVSIDDVNVLKDKTWSIDYECDVECQQKLYNPNVSFKFIYRPINMSNPFPNKRTPGDNWIPFMDDVEAGKTKAKDKLTRNTPEYKVYLSEAEINKIKNYNKTNNYNYTSIKTISDGGRSTFLRDTLGITNLVKTNSFNKLGECTKNCWPTSSRYDGWW